MRSAPLGHCIATPSGKGRGSLPGTQNAMLPAFVHAAKNSVLAALVSDDPKKLKTLGKKYNVERLYSYDQYDDCLRHAAHVAHLSHRQ